MDAILVPLYGVCVFLYLGRLLQKAIHARNEKKPALSLSQSPSIPPPLPSVAAISETSSTLTPEDGGKVNMSGSYLLVRNDNFESFLEVQGVPWALRRAANQARPIHQITHVGKSVTIQIKGIIESQTTYQIDGPPVETNVRGRVFRDQMTYLESGDGIRVSKTAITENYDITVTRRLTTDRQTINMTSSASFKDGRPPIESRQVFKRIQ